MKKLAFFILLSLVTLGVSAQSFFSKVVRIWLTELAEKLK